MFVGLDSTRSVDFLYHVALVEICLSDLVVLFNMYPGIHNAEKPNGKLQIIFHVGMSKLCIRRNLVKKFAISIPGIYSNKIVDSVIVKMKRLVD